MTLKTHIAIVGLMLGLLGGAFATNVNAQPASSVSLLSATGAKSAPAATKPAATAATTAAASATQPATTQPATASAPPVKTPAVQPGVVASDAVKKLLDQYKVVLNDPKNPPKPDDLQKAYLIVWVTVSNSFHDPAKMQAWGWWQHHFDGKLKTTDDLEKALSIMLASLHEPTTGYTSAAAVAAQAKAPAPDSTLSPLGLTLAKQPNGTFTIDYLAYGSPAYNSDLRTGDMITSIGGKPLNKDTAPQDADALTRVKTGDKVEIAFRHEGKDDKAVLTSAAQPAAKVTADLAKNGVLTIRLPDFSQEQVETFENTVVQAEQATHDQLPGVILDLRGNAGGNFDNAISVAGLFIADGPLVSATTREGRLVTPKTYMIIPPFPDRFAGNPELAHIIANLYGVPMVVLTDNSTGGAAEILAAALKDNKRAVIVGETTYGRNVSSTKESLPTGGVLTITATDYVTPAGTNLSGKGLTPSKVVAHARASKTDEVMAAAGKELTNQMAAAKKSSHPSSSQSDSDDNGSSGFSTKILSAFSVAMLLLGISLYALYERQRKQREAEKKNKKSGR